MGRSSETGAVATRRQALLDYVIEQGGAQLDELAARFAASRMTIHRDVQALADNGLLRRVHGGVTSSASGSVETSVVNRVRHATREKRAIAAVAARLIVPGQILVLDDSTTAALLAEHLPMLGPLTVVTNSQGIAGRLSSARDISLISLGGQYRPTFDAYLGRLCETSISALRGNTLFMSVSAIFGVTAYHQDQEIIRAKLAMMEIVERRVLMVDSKKFDVCALNRLAPLSDFDVVITDSGLPASVRHHLEEADIPLQIACLGEAAAEPAPPAGATAQNTTETEPCV